MPWYTFTHGVVSFGPSFAEANGGIVALSLAIAMVLLRRERAVLLGNDVIESALAIGLALLLATFNWSVVAYRLFLKGYPGMALPVLILLLTVLFAYRTDGLVLCWMLVALPIVAMAVAPWPFGETLGQFCDLRCQATRAVNGGLFVGSVLYLVGRGMRLVVRKVSTSSTIGT